MSGVALSGDFDFGRSGFESDAIVTERYAVVMKSELVAANARDEVWDNMIKVLDFNEELYSEIPLEGFEQIKSFTVAGEQVCVAGFIYDQPVNSCNPSSRLRAACASLEKGAETWNTIDPSEIGYTKRVSKVEIHGNRLTVVYRYGEPVAQTSLGYCNRNTWNTAIRTFDVNTGGEF